MKILLLGTLLNPLSIACLKALCGVQTYALLVGIESPWRGGLFRAFVRRWKRYGRNHLFQKIRFLLVSIFQNRVRTNALVDTDIHSLLTMAIRHKVEHFWCDNIHGEESLRIIRNYSPDLIVVASFSQILRTQILEIPSKGSVNVHPSLLPRYRGPSPIYWVLKNKEVMSGVTVHYIEDRIDSGDMILQKQMSIEKEDNETTLESKCSSVAGELLLSAIELIREGKVKRWKQKEEDATYYSFPRMTRSGL